MALSQQGRDVMRRKQSAEHIEECSHADDARNSPEKVNEAISKQRYNDYEAAENHDAEAIVDMEQLTYCLTGQHAAAGRKADVHQAHRHDRYDCAIDAELDAARDHLG